MRYANRKISHFFTQALLFFSQFDFISLWFEIALLHLINYEGEGMKEMNKKRKRNEKAHVKMHLGELYRYVQSEWALAKDKSIYFHVFNGCRGLYWENCGSTNKNKWKNENGSIAIDFLSFPFFSKMVYQFKVPSIIVQRTKVWTILYNFYTHWKWQVILGNRWKLKFIYWYF